MASLTVANYLGMLQDDPEDPSAFEGLREALQSGDPERVPESPLRLLEAARHAHEKRGELQAVAWLIELEANISEDDPSFQAALYKELGRIRHEELLDDPGAIEAYQKCLAINGEDEDVELAVDEMTQTSEKWRQIADRFIEEASDASDATLKTSMLARAGALVWQYRKKGRARETDKLFKQALKADPASTRTARLYCVTLKERDRWKDVAGALSTTADAARNRDEKLNFYVQAARVFIRRLEDNDSAASCYTRALDLVPGHEEALRFLVEHFTEREEWDHLVALYEDALRSRQKLESEQGILLQIGMVHWRIRNQPDQAEPYFARLRKIDPAHPGMLGFYREHLASIVNGEDADAAKEARSRLLTILGDAQRVAETDEQKQELAVELARAAQAIGATERAIDAWKAVQRIDPSHAEAGSALRDLYRRGEKWNALVEVMRAELEALPAKSEDEEIKSRRVALLRELIAIYRDQLKLDVMVINTYNALLEEEPGDRGALDELAKTYEGMGRWNDLIKVLERQAEAATDPVDQVDLYMRVARLWIDRFANYNQATKPLEQVIEVEPEHREALSQLKTIYTKKRSWKALYAVLQKEAALASDPEARLHMKIELAKLAGDRLHRNADAIVLWREVLEVAPETEGALDTLEKLAEREKDWPTLAYALEERVGREEDEKKRIKVLQKLGGVYGDHTNEPHKAAQAWKRILELDPKNGRALRTLREAFLQGQDWDGLEALYAEAGDWEGLVDVLGNAAERNEDPEVKKTLSFRAAHVYEEKIGKPERAFRSYERVLSVDPTNVDAATALIPIYEAQEKWSRLVKLREILLDALPEDTPKEERLEAIETLRRLSAEKLSDEQAAFGWAGRAYALQPSDEVLRQLEASAERAGAWETFADTLKRRIARDDASDEERTGLRKKLASIAGERLGKTDEAISQLQQILESEPSDAEAIEVLDRLYRGESRTDDLRKLYLHRIEHGEETVELLVELAELEEDVFDDAESAVSRYRRALELDATHPQSLAAVDRLAVAAERWEEVADIVARRREVEDDPTARQSFTLRLGDLYRQRLGRKGDALTEYGALLDAEPTHPQAVVGVEALATDEDLQLRAGRLLEQAYEASGQYQKLQIVLQFRLDQTEDEEERRALQLRLAELAGTALGDADGAYAALESAFLDRPADMDLWDRLANAADAAGKHEALATAFTTALEAADLGDTEVALLSAKVAELYDTILGRPQDAEEHHKRVLHADPMDPRAFEALKELYTNQERWDELQVLYRNRIAETIDGEAKLELLMQVCFLFEEILDDPQLAIRSYQEVLELEPEHLPSRRALERLFRRTERWRDLVALLRQGLDRSEDEHQQLALIYEIGELHERELKEPGVAVDQYETLLERDPKHVKAQQALERLLDEQRQRQRIASILEPLYDQQGAWAELARVLEVQLEDVTDPGGQIGLLTRLALLHENKLHDPDKAFGALSRAVLADPADAAVRKELARLATMRDSQRERAEILEQAIEKSDSGYLQGELLLELAKLWDEEVADFDEAERAYSRLIDVAGDNPESVLPAARALERIHLSKGDDEKLAQDLRLQIRLEYDQEVRAQLLVRLATLLEDTLDDVDGAIAAHRQRLDVDPMDVDALLALERLYERRGEWQKLIGVLQSREQAVVDEEQQREIAKRIGVVYETKLEDVDNAIVAHNDVLSRFGPDAETLNALARLYERSEKWDDLLEIVQMQLSETADADAGADLKFKAAQLMRTRTDDVERAIETYAEVLAVRPGHPGTVEALEEVVTDPDSDFRVEAARTLVTHYEANGLYGELIDVLEVVAETDDPYEKLNALRRAAEIAEMGKEDPKQAFQLTGKAVRAGLAEDDLPQMLADLERHAAAADEWVAYVALLEDVAPEILDGDLQAQALMSLASTAQTRLGDDEKARRFFRRVLDSRPDHRPALDALEALYGSAGDHAALLEILKRKTEIAESPDQRIALLEQQADLCEHELDDVASAIDAHEQVLIEREDRLEAYEALRRLYTKAERYAELAGVHERQLDAGVGSAVEARHALGVVSLEHLSDPYAALDHLKEALALDGNHEPSIEALEKLMATEEHRAAAAEVLEPVFLARMDWPKVTGALEARLASTHDVDERKQLLRRLGQIHEDYLEELEGAFATYARLFREDPRDRSVWDLLERLAKILEEWLPLATVYGEAVDETGVTETETMEIAARAARLYDERGDDAEKAAHYWAMVLEFEPTDRDAFEALERAYVGLGRWPELLGLYRRRVDVAESDEERVQLLHKAATIQEQKLGERDRAIDAYREALEHDPNDVTATDALDRLLTADERWPELAEHLRFRIDGARGTGVEHDLQHRLGVLLATKLEDDHAALDVFEEVVRERPDHAATITALEGYMGHEEHQLRVTQILEPIYRGQDEWQKLVTVLEAQVALATDPVDRVRLLGEIGRLHEERGQDGIGAFRAWSRAFAADPHEETARKELDRLAGLLGAWDEHVAAYEQAIAQATDPTVVSSLLATMARVHDEKRGDPRAAIQTYERLADHDPDDVSALDALEALHTMVGDWQGMVDVLNRKVERSYDPVERSELLRRAGSVLEELLGDPKGAVDLYRRASEEDPDDPISLEALDRLYSNGSQFELLVDVLRRRIELETDLELKVELGLRLAQLAEMQLNQPSDAIDALVRVLETSPSHPDAVASLSRLYERQAMWPELLDNLRLQAGMAETAEQRVAFVHRSGEVYERELDDVLEAITMYQQALELDSRHQPSLNALIRISHLEDYRTQAAEILEPLLEVQERWNELADLYALKAEAAHDPFDKKAELNKLARVQEHGRQDLDAAFEATARALAEDPADEETAENLERLAAATDGYPRLADELASRAQAGFDPMVARSLYVRLARIAEERLDDDARAVDAYSRALDQVGDEDDLLAALDRLHVKREAWTELAGVLERRIGLANDPTERASLLVRLGTVRQEHFGDLRGAFASFQEVVERDPGDTRALDALETLGQHEELALDVVDTLENAYRETGAMDRIVGLYDIRINLADSDGERVRMLQEAARLWENDLAQPDKALDSMRRAFELDPRDESLLEEVERLATMSDGWESLRGMIERVGAHEDLDGIMRRDLNLRGAGWYRDRLGDLEAAEGRLRAAVEADPDAAEPHEQLVGLLRAPGREADLVAALRGWADVEMDGEVKKERLREAARLAESALGQPGVAAEHLEAILAVDASDPDALDDLARIREGEERWDQVVRLLERRVDVETDPQQRLGIRRRLAEVLAGPGEDPVAATVAWENVLDEAPEDLGAIEALESLYEKAERWEDLRGLLDRRLDIAATDDERITARVRLARLDEQAFGRREDAMTQLREILQLDPNNAAALDELERLLGLEERWDELVELLERRASDAAAVGDTDAQRAVLGRLAEVHEDRRGDVPSAVVAHERILGIDAANEGSLRKLVALHEQVEDWASVAQTLERLLPLLEGSDAVSTCRRLAEIAEEKLGDADLAERALQQAHELQPSATSRELLKAHHEKHQKWAKLATILDAEVESAPSDEDKVALLKRVANIYMEQLDDAGTGASYLERAVALTPDDREVLLPLCDLYIAAGRQADAVPVLEKIIESFGRRRTKELAQYHHRLGQALQGMGDTAGALEQFDAAFKVDLTNVAILRDLGKLTHAQQDWARAQKTFRALLLQKLTPEAGISKADVYYYLGDISAKTGDNRKAISMLERAVSEQKDHPEASALLAELKG